MSSQSGKPGKSGSTASSDNAGSAQRHRRRVIGASLVVALLLLSGLGTWLAFSLTARSNTAATAPSPSAAAMRGLIVVASSADDGSVEEILSMRPEGTQRTVLSTKNKDTDPELSPDGRNIVFLRCVAGTDCDAIGTVNVWMMRSDGSEAHAVTACTGTNCYGAGAPTFSPDGQWIAFGLDQVESDGANYEGIFVSRPDGSELRRITKNGKDNPPDENPHFSPDGTTIVFDREAADGTQKLMTVRTDGTQLKDLGIAANAFSASWSPSGNRIAFSLSVKEGDTTISDVATAPAAGGAITIVSADTADNPAFLPSYSPDARWIVYSQRADDGDCDLKIVPAAGGSATTIDGDGACLNAADWGRVAPSSSN